MSNSFARNVAQDAGIGAILGLLLVSGLITSNLDMRQLLANGQEPLSSLAVIVSVVVMQCAIAAAFCGVFVRRFFAAEDTVEAQRLDRLSRAQFNRSQFRVVPSGQRVALAYVEAPSRRRAANGARSGY